MNATIQRIGCLGLCAAAALAAGVVRAEGDTWYMTTAESTSSYGALWTASKWNSAEDGSGSPATAFSETDTYVAKATIIAAGSNRTFAGGPLIAKAAFWTLAAGSFSFPRGIELQASQWRNRYGAFDVYGPVTITYTAYPFTFFCDGSAVTTFHGPLIGASNIRITCGESNSAGEGSTFIFAGDNSAYYGSANVKPTGKGGYTKAGFASFPGKMAVQNNAVLLVGAAGADTVSTYKTLEIASGATLELLAKKDGGVFKFPSLAATDSLTVGDAVTIAFPSAAWPDDGLPHVFDVLTAPEGASLGAENFTLKTTDGEALSSDYLVVSEDGRTLRIVFPAVIPSGVTFLTGETPTSGVMKLADLTLESGAILKLNGAWSGTGDGMTYSSASVAVSSSLTVNAPVVVTATRYAVPADGKEHTIDILKAPAGVAIDPADFVFKRTEDGVQLATLGVRQDDGRDVLTVTFEPVVEMVASDKASTGKAADTTSDTAWYAAASWSDCQTPHEGAHYLVRQPTPSSTEWFFRTPTDNVNLTFPGDSLTLDTNVWLVIFQTGGHSLTIGDLRLRGGSSLLCGQSTYSTVKGKITLEGGSVNVGSCGNSITLASALHGTGALHVSGPRAYGSLAQGSTSVEGDNSAFFGTYDVEHSRADPDTDKKYQTLQFKASAHVGGNLPAFSPAAFRLAKYSVLKIAGDVVVAAESNRGLTTDGLGGFIEVVSDKTFTLGTRMTLTGPLTKKGAGTLVLGGDAVADGAAFTVSEGRVVVAGAEAFNGVRATLAEGTSIALAVNPADETLCRYGIRNVKTDTPFALASGTQLPFSLIVSEEARAELKKGAKRLGLVTVSANAAPTVRAMLAGLAFKVPGLTLTPFEAADGETGDVTFGVVSEPAGLVIILR